LKADDFVEALRVGGVRPRVAAPLDSVGGGLAGEMLSVCSVAMSTCSGRADGPTLATK